MTPEMMACSMVSSASLTMVPGVSLKLERQWMTTPWLRANSTAAHLQDARAARRHLEHLLVGEHVDLARVGHDARVGGVDAVDVGVDLADVGADAGGHGDRRGVGAAAAERGDRAVGVMPWKPATMTILPCVERLAHAVGTDLGDLGLAVDRVGDDADLRAGEGDRVVALGDDRHREQRDRDLLAGGQQHVHLAVGRLGA